MNIIEKMFGTHSQRELKRIMPIVDKIDSLRPSMRLFPMKNFVEKQGSIKNVWKKVKHWMIYFRKHLQPYVRQQREY